MKEEEKKEKEEVKKPSPLAAAIVATIQVTLALITIDAYSLFQLQGPIGLIFAIAVLAGIAVSAGDKKNWSGVNLVVWILAVAMLTLSSLIPVAENYIYIAGQADGIRTNIDGVLRWRCFEPAVRISKDQTIRVDWQAVSQDGMEISGPAIVPFCLDLYNPEGIEKLSIYRDPDWVLETKLEKLAAEIIKETVGQISVKQVDGDISKFIGKKLGDFFRDERISELKELGISLATLEKPIDIPYVNLVRTTR